MMLGVILILQRLSHSIKKKYLEKQNDVSVRHLIDVHITLHEYIGIFPAGEAAVSTIM